MRTVSQKLTTQLNALARNRSNHTVTADDAQRILNRWNYSGSRNFIGSILKSNFRSTGYLKSKTPTNRSRTIRAWRA